MNVLVNLSEQYHFPTSLAYSNLRPDLVIHSDHTKTATIVELTVCFEERRKYSELVEEVKGNGYDVDLVTVKVDSRGFAN